MALQKMKIFNSVASKIVCTVKSSQHFSKRGLCSFYGVPKEKVKLEVVGNTLSFEAEAVEIPCDEGIRAYYSSIELNPIFYNLAKVQAEAKQELLDEEQHYVEELKDVVYEADDLLDEFITLIEQKKIRQ
uniref:Disease resistance N-terminal domain-containing protein n=1 Tax=Chenopodium quinoa TaxID=63459 RepID=A0A803NBM0_CHEQI